MKYTNSTIVAPATLVGNSSISILRISGKNTFTILEKCFFKSAKVKTKVNFTKIKSHTLLHGYLIHDEVIDEVVLAIYKSPNSYTGEDVAEVSIHGGGIIFKKALSLILNKGCRIAEPGEFTKRAFLNGKIDLMQAEAVSDLIKASSDLAASSAIKKLQGEQKDIIYELRKGIIDLCSIYEAQIDFQEEEIENFSKEKLLIMLNSIIEKTERLIKSYSYGKKIPNGINIAIIGEPNVGKSSIFNRLVNYSRAIVSDYPGTTRDYISESINLGGFSFNFIDTAGIREANNSLEMLGIENTFSVINEVDIIIHVSGIETYNHQKIKEVFKNKNVIMVANKIDLIPNRASLKGFDLLISAKTGENFESFMEEIIHCSKRMIFSESHTDNYITNERHYNKLLKSCEHLVNARNLIFRSSGNELIAFELKNSAIEIDELIGKTTNEDILNNIFTKFCIGK